MVSDNQVKARELVQICKAWGLKREDVRAIAVHMRFMADADKTWIDPLIGTGFTARGAFDRKGNG